MKSKHFKYSAPILFFLFLYISPFITSCDKDESIEKTTPNNNLNANKGDNAYVHNLEIPQLNHKKNSVFITNTTNYNGGKVVTYSVEQDTELRHPRWVAFTFDVSTSQDRNVGRTGSFTSDPSIPINWQSNNFDFGSGGYDGIDRGHLCASEDRQYSETANAQTFYFTNMSPQYSAFNQKIWASLEHIVQTWGRTYTNPTDTLFVTKGGTISTGMTINEPGVNVMPKYYYMALLSKKYNTANKQYQYKAIAFWLEHKKAAYPTPYNFKQFAITINELESKTGIDFFCNLPDKLEEIVENKLDTSAWAGL